MQYGFLIEKPIKVRPDKNFFGAVSEMRILGDAFLASYSVFLPERGRGRERERDRETVRRERERKKERKRERKIKEKREREREIVRET